MGAGPVRCGAVQRAPHLMGELIRTVRRMIANLRSAHFRGTLRGPKRVDTRETHTHTTHKPTGDVTCKAQLIYEQHIRASVFRGRLRRSVVMLGTYCSRQPEGV